MSTSLLPIQVTVNPSYRRDVRTVCTARPPGQEDGQPSPVSTGGYIKDPPPPALPKPPETPGGLWTPEGWGSSVPPEEADGPSVDKV